MRGFTRHALIFWAGCCSIASPRAAGTVAPVQIVGMRCADGVALLQPGIAERRQDHEPRMIEALLFRLEGPAGGLAGLEARVRLVAPSGQARTFHSRLSGGAAGSTHRIPVRVPITDSATGAWRAAVTILGADGGTVCDGELSFGYPRYSSSRGLERVRSGAAVRDDFESAAVDGRLWRLWISDPGRADVAQRGGRLWIDVRGSSGYNGLVSIAGLPTRDVEAICRAGIDSMPGAKHGALLHLCGSGTLSPDHWLEVQLRDGGAGGRASINVAVPPEHRSGYTGTYDLPAPRAEGYLLRVSCEEATGACRGQALAPFGPGDGGEWWQLGDGFVVPARQSRLEIKVAGWAEPDAGSRIWFDDCRLYPRPQTHGVTVVLKRPGGDPPAAGTDCFGPENQTIGKCELTVRLHDADGGRLIAEASTGTGFGYGVLSLARSGWDIHPVGAVIRVFAHDRQIGPDHVIRGSGVNGLYPDDVYEITLD